MSRPKLIKTNYLKFFRYMVWLQYINVPAHHIPIDPLQLIAVQIKTVSIPKS